MNGWQINNGLCASEAGLTTNQILTGVGLIIALAVLITTVLAEVARR